MTKIFYFLLIHKKTSLFLIFILFVITASLIGMSVRNKRDNQGILATPTPVLPSNFVPGSKIPTPVIKRAPSLQTNKLGTVIFSLPTVSFPADLTIYKTEGSGIDQTQAQNIANSFSINITPQTINPNLYVWNSEDRMKSLTVYLDSGLLIYTNAQARGKEDASIVSIKSDDDIKKVTNDFLQKQRYLGKNLVINKILYHRGEEQSSTIRDPSSATSFELTLKRVLNNVPLFYQYGTSSSASIIMDTLGMVRRFSYVFISYQGLEKRLLLSIEEAERKIQNGEGIIVSYGDNQGANIPPLLSTNINSVSIAYLDDRTTGFLVPIFVFTGTSNSTTTTNVPITTYLPAMR
ncbi:MAG: hypothetical protein M1372_02060 [Patescibacteria group bacterium]|nr:hypothetical protein [Patescibacteria group bacterium]